MEDQAATAEAEKEFAKAQAALAAGDTLTALVTLERALKLQDNPAWHSSLGYCIARERGQLRKALELCQASLDQEPDNAVHFLNLGRVHLLAGDRLEALRVLREGMAREGNAGIRQLLDSLGMRKAPVLPMLSRDNPLNKYLGLLFSRLGIR